MATHAVTTGGWDRRRLIYGDWSWFIRDGLDVLRLVFLAGVVVFAVRGNSDVVALTGAFAVLLIARIVDLPRWLDFGLVVAMTLIAYGTALHFYGHWFYYDLGGHFVKGLWDTETDLACDAAGSIVGATFITVWALPGWSSRCVTVVPAPGPCTTPLAAGFGVAMLASGGRGLDLVATLLGIGFVAIGSLRLVRALAAHRPGGAGAAG